MDLSTLLKYSRKNLKLIVVVVLCCALLAGGVKMLTDYVTYSKDSQTIPQLQAKLDSLEAQKNALHSDIDKIDNNEEYISVKDMNASRLLKYTAVYYIDRNVDMYNTVINDINVIEKAYSNSNIELSFNVVDMLIDFTANSSYRSLTIHVSAKNEEQLSKLKDIAEQCFSHAKDTIRITLGSSTIHLLSENESFASNSAIANLQKSYTDRISTINTSIGEIDTQITETNDTLSKIQFTLFSKDVFQYTLLGLILGVFLAYVFILGRLYLSPKFLGIEQLMAKISLLASGKDIEKLEKACVVPVIYACGKTEEHIGVLSSGNISHAKRIFSSLKEQTEYNLMHLENIFNSSDIAKTLLDCKGIILVEKCNVSRVKDIEKIINMCKNNNITIYGIIIIE